MQCINVAFLLCLIFGVAVRAVDRKDLQKHNNRLKEYPCKNPQPRVLELEDLNNEELSAFTNRGLRDKIKPHVTVLHRCQGTGCCQNPEERCMPVEPKEVTLTFAITDRSLRFVEVKAKNHTECACSSDQEDNDIK